MNFDTLHEKKGFAALACALIVAGIVLMAFSIFRVQRTTLQNERGKMMLIAKSTASSVENYLQGCLSGIRLTDDSQPVADAVAKYLASGDGGELLRLLLRIVQSEEHPAITDVFLTNAFGDALLATSSAAAFENIGTESGNPGDGKLRVLRKNDGKIFLGVHSPAGGGAHFLYLIDVERLYNHTASFVAIGEKGYVMLKHSGGVIISHPVPDQVGTDVLSGRKKRFPHLDYTELERLIANQEQAKEGLETYHSYWWAESPPPRVKKISAYTPVFLLDDFIIVSAVTDYAELLRPVQTSSFVIVASATLASLGVIALLHRYRRKGQRKIKEENEYLRQLNKSLDEMARRQEEMRHDQRLQLIGTLTGGIAHEFRNLLTPIMGYAGLLRESLPPDSPMREDIEEIYGSAVKAKEIIQQITSLSRKSLKPEFTPIRLEDAIPGILKVANASKPADYEIVCALDFGGGYVMGNRTQISQIVLNLCHNAFQARREGTGRLAITGRAIGENGGKIAEVRFEDDGAGIAPQDLQRIFDPFFTTKKVGEGTGLGLSVVQNIVDLHNGTIAAESEAGKGSVFILHFPLVTSDGKEIPAGEPAPRTAEEPPDIVLVEDEEAVLGFLRKGLERSGYAVRAFSDPRAALEETGARPARLLLTDYMMPGMTGAELAVRVRRATPETKIIILTGYADQEVLDQLRHDVIDGYQIKPVQISELTEKINGLFA